MKMFHCGNAAKDELFWHAGYEVSMTEVKKEK